MSVVITTGLEPLALLNDLVRIPSVTGDVDAAAARLLEVVADAGFDAHRDIAGNVVMTWGEGAADDEILLLGHLDTVPGEIAVRHDDGRLHGRGTVDAKGPLAAALTAVSRLPRNPGRRVTVIAACDEEGASLGARHLCSRIGPTHLVVLEPSGWDTVTTAYRGCVRVTVTVRRSTTHHAGPFAGAADVLVALLGDAQRALHRDAERAVDRVQMRVNALNTHEDGSSERADAAIEVRIPGGVAVDAILAQLSGLLGDAHLKVVSACEPVAVSRGNPVARALARAITVAGGRPRYTTKTGTSDLNVVLPAWGCAAAVYGPGDCSLDHTPRESIDVGELRRGADVLEAAVRSLR
ncbi:MAG: M20/M25/M40 family metallo-hydrolase [Candidatus Dormibacter sp.]